MPNKRSFAIIIPAYNEEELLPLTLLSVKQSIKAITSHSGKIIVVDNNSNDRTADIAREMGAEVVFEPINQISKARNSGARASSEAEYLLFLDADSLLTPQLLSTTLTLLDSGKVCGGGALFKMHDSCGKIITAMWAIISTTLRLAGGGYIYCLNKAYKESGGFDEKLYAAEDVFFSRSLKKWGRKHKLKFKVITKEKVLTSDRKLKWYSKWELLKTFLFIAIMPWNLKKRDKMKLWYDRPQEKKSEVKRKS